MQNSILNPKVLVRCMTYNHEKYIEDALNGFIIQKTDFPFTVAIVDDASTDNNVTVIKEFISRNCDCDRNYVEEKKEYGQVIQAQAKDNSNCHFYVILLNENHYSDPNKRALRHFYYKFIEDRAKYIAMCEGDDYWTDPYKLQKQEDYMEAHPECGLCYCDCDIFYEKSDTFLKCINASGNSKIDIVHPMFSYGYLSNMTWLWRSGIPIHITPGVMDGAIEMLLNIALNSKIGFCEGPSVGVYRRHEGSASCFKAEDVEREYNYHVNTFKLMLSYIDKFSDARELKKHIIGGSIFDLYEKALQRGDNETISVFERYFSDFIDINIINNEIKLKYRYLEECRKIRSSKAYRLGKLLLKPFRWMKKFKS